jgi:alpha-L-fucosidase
MSRDDILHHLANAVVRNMPMLLNVAPDRHGVMSQVQQQRLREVGEWLKKCGDSVYGTRGGPWQPVDRQYGYCYKGNTVFVHLLKGYSGDRFDVPELGALRATKVYELYTGKELKFNGDAGTHIEGIDRTASPADTVIAIVYNDQVQTVWQKGQ